MGWQWAGLGGGAMAGHLQLQIRHYASALVAGSNNLTVKMLLSGDLPTVEQTIRRSTKSEGSGMTHGPVLCLYLGRMVYSQPGHANWGPDISYALVIGKCDGTANTYSRLGVVELHEAGGFHRGLSAATKDHRRKQGHLLRDASTIELPYTYHRLRFHPSVPTAGELC
jgi:hypothetical protein